VSELVSWVHEEKSIEKLSQMDNDASKVSATSKDTSKMAEAAIEATKKLEE
jgi:hypothetical protein